MPRIPRLPLLLFFSCAFPLLSLAQQPNGVIDDLSEMTTRQEVMVPMSDSVQLATDIFLPILSDDLGFEEIEVDVGPILGLSQPFNVTVDYLKMAAAGTQLFYYPNQSDSAALPGIFTRTPYNKQDPTQGQIEALLGFAGIVQDMRGRYNSEGTYIPMHSDSWSKVPYLADSTGHLLDITPGYTANSHEDGWESAQWLVNDLRRDSAGNIVMNPGGQPALNGSLGMFGASALGNTQLQAAAAHRTDYLLNGIKCLMPIVATGEHYQATGHHNGVYRERIIDGWLRGQVEQYSEYQDTLSDGGVNDGVHTMADYGPQVSTPLQAAERAIDSWTVWMNGHYPDGVGRSTMDISAAPVDATGEGAANGTHSRYENLQLPSYHITGWWDIFIDGQIMTWQQQLAHARPDVKPYQKMVIGPWAHQTIGTRETGDMRNGYLGQDFRYKANVSDVLGVDVDLDNVDLTELPKLANSELMQWFRAWLGGDPVVQLPAQDDWQYVLGPVQGFLPDSVFLMVPAEPLQVSYVEFFNFLNGADSLYNVPIRVRGVDEFDSTEVQIVTIPPLPESVIGDTSNTALQPATAYNWDSIPNVRFYVVGPIADGIDGQNGNPAVGNYWYATDTFPLPNTTPFNLYFRADGRLSPQAPVSDEGTRTLVADPNNPVNTHGGPNMIVRTPDDNRNSQGQMDFANPQYLGFTLERDSILIDGTFYTDQLAFESGEVEDSLAIAGFPLAKLYAATAPTGSGPQDSTSCDFMVRVLDVYPDGREMYVFEGAVNARARRYAASWAAGQEDRSAAFDNVVPDSVYEYSFRMLPIAYTWGKGHKVKVLISNTNYPRFQPNANIPLEPRSFYRRRPFEQKAYNYFGQEIYPRQSIQQLAFSDVYAGHIQLPLLGPASISVSRPETLAEVQAGAFELWPNPASSYVRIRLQEAQQARWSLRDVNGRQLRSGEFTGYGTRLPLSDLPAGIYLLRVTGERSGPQTRKVLVR